ncbi:hypothetical protein BN903_93 [Halorubrum sp. AJ67]|nr:hypothetical protein BN903_93 [Halorubrum sp. AJ67]
MRCPRDWGFGGVRRTSDESALVANTGRKVGFALSISTP